MLILILENLLSNINPFNLIPGFNSTGVNLPPEFGGEVTIELLFDFLGIPLSNTFNGSLSYEDVQQLKSRLSYRFKSYK